MGGKFVFVIMDPNKSSNSDPILHGVMSGVLIVNYIQIPLQVSFYPFPLFPIFINAGCTFNLGTTGTIIYSSNPKKIEYKFNQSDWENLMRRFNIGFLCDLGYIIHPKFLMSFYMTISASFHLHLLNDLPKTSYYRSSLLAFDDNSDPTKRWHKFRGVYFSISFGKFFDLK